MNLPAPCRTVLYRTTGCNAQLHPAPPYHTQGNKNGGGVNLCRPVRNTAVADAGSRNHAAPSSA